MKKKNKNAGCSSFLAYVVGVCIVLRIAIVIVQVIVEVIQEIWQKGKWFTVGGILIILAGILIWFIHAQLEDEKRIAKEQAERAEREAAAAAEKAAKEAECAAHEAAAKAAHKAPAAPAKPKAAAQTETEPLKGGIKYEPSLNEYRMFSEPAQLHKSINQLRGMLGGIAADGNMSEMEVAELAHWCSLHANLRSRHPFSEILPLVEKAMADGKIDEEERQDVLWVCTNFADDSHYYNVITSSIQFLNGLVHGILADNQLSDKEIEALNTWVTHNDYLEGTYPFDRLYILVNRILHDKKISEAEREELTAFLGGIVEFKDSLNLDVEYFEELRKKYSIDGIYAVNPEISFANKAFVLSGEFETGTKQTALEAINRLGGVVRTNPSGRTDFLVIGNFGNPCWKFANYGRKVEAALEIQRNGGKVQIINENDFWDAVDDQ